MKNHSKTLILVECAIMLSLAAALSLLKLFEMPMGGSVTPLSMLPIALISIKYGSKVGLPMAFLFSVTELSLSKFAIFGWGLTPAALVGSLLLDYIVAYSVLGFAGAFRKHGLKGWLGGIAMVITARFVCHFASGVIIFSQWAKDMHPLMYSLLYNGTYMLPELGFTMVGAVFLLETPYVKKLFTPIGLNVNH